MLFLAPFPDGMVLYMEKPKHSPKKLLKLIINLAKSQFTKSMYKKLEFLYTHNELIEREIMKETPFTIVTKKPSV